MSGHGGVSQHRVRLGGISANKDFFLSVMCASFFSQDCSDSSQVLRLDSKTQFCVNTSFINA